MGPKIKVARRREAAARRFRGRLCQLGFSAWPTAAPAAPPTAAPTGPATTAPATAPVAAFCSMVWPQAATPASAREDARIRTVRFMSGSIAAKPERQLGQGVPGPHAQDSPDRRLHASTANPARGQSSARIPASACVERLWFNTVFAAITWSINKDRKSHPRPIPWRGAAMLHRSAILRINHIAAINRWLKARPRQPACSPTVDLPQPGRDPCVAPAARLPGGGVAPC